MILTLPRSGDWIEYSPREDRPDLTLHPDVRPVREAYAAAHVVASRGYRYTGGAVRRSDIDWKATIAHRRRLWELGFGVAEAMDTAQRGGELGWELASELLSRTLQTAAKDPRRRPVIGGAGADMVSDPDECSLDEVVDSYVEQIRFITERGGAPIIFPNDILPARFPEPASYISMINGIVECVEGPLYLHWLGARFNPKMKRYWGYADIGESARRVVIPLMEKHRAKIKGIKLSILDPAFEEWFRWRIARNGQVVLTGDDLNFPELIAGKNRYQPTVRWSPRAGVSYPLGDFSHALLGIFDGIAPLAAKALEHLAGGKMEHYELLMKGAQRLSRHIFFADTPGLTGYYKVGLVFLAYLNGHQDHFKLIGGLEEKLKARLPHPEAFLEYLSDIFCLADQAGLIADIDGAYNRFLKILHDSRSTEKQIDLRLAPQPTRSKTHFDEGLKER